MADLTRGECTLRLTRNGDVPVIEATGEVDLRVESSFLSLVEEALTTEAAPLVIDLTKASYLDSAGMHVLVHARRKIGKPERLAVAVAPGGLPERVLKLGMFDRWMVLAPSLESAVERVRSDVGEGD
jgi:anti-anti-sigma factor